MDQDLGAGTRAPDRNREPFTVTRKSSPAPDVPEGAVLYIRQSVTRRVRDRQGRKTAEIDTVSPELQETAGRDYCARKGYPVVAIVTDLNRTGRTLRRRSVQEAIGYIERDQAKIIVVWKWSRLARNRRDFAVTCDHIEATVGGRVESSTEPIDVTTAVGRLSRGVLAEIAAFESERAGEVSREVIDNRVADGLPGTARDRFGYVNVGRGRFAPHPELGDVLGEMYRRYIAGTGYRGIARWLNEQGHTTTAGGIFREGNVRTILDSGFGAGRILHRGQHLPGVHPAVITDEEWAEYERVRDHRSKLPSRTKGSPYVLSGLTKCGVCGGALNPRAVRGQVWYRCKSRSLMGCPNSESRLDRIEEAVLNWLRGLVDDFEAAARGERRAQRKVVTHRHRVETLARRIQREENALARLTADRARGLIPDDDAYVAARDEITRTRDRLEDEHRDASRVVRAGSRFDAGAYRGLLAEWATTPVQVRQEMLRRLLARVRVWGKPFRVQPVPIWEDADVERVDPTATGKRPTRIELDAGRHALADDQALAILAKHAAGQSMSSLAREYGVGAATVFNLVKRTTYRHLPDRT